MRKKYYLRAVVTSLTVLLLTVGMTVGSAFADTGLTQRSLPPASGLLEPDSPTPELPSEDPTPTPPAESTPTPPTETTPTPPAESTPTPPAESTPTPTTPPGEDPSLTLSDDSNFLLMDGVPILARLRIFSTNVTITLDEDYSVPGFDGYWIDAGAVIPFTISVDEGHKISRLTPSSGTLNYLDEYDTYELTTPATLGPIAITIRAEEITDITPDSSPTPTPSGNGGSGQMQGDAFVIEDEGSTISLPYKPERSKYIVFDKQLITEGDEFTIAISSIDKDVDYEVHYYSLTYTDGVDVPLQGPATISISLPEGRNPAFTKVYAINTGIGTITQLDSKGSSDGKAVEFETYRPGYYVITYSKPAGPLNPTATPTVTPVPTKPPTPTEAPPAQAPAPPEGNPATSFLMTLLYMIGTFGLGAAAYFYIIKPKK